MPRLDRWSIQYVNSSSDPYRPPELCERALTGSVSGHPRFPEGHRIHTSPITQVLDSGELVSQSGTVYELGEVDPGYEAYCPNARERFLRSLVAGFNSTEVNR